MQETRGREQIRGNRRGIDIVGVGGERKGRNDEDIREVRMWGGGGGGRSSGNSLAFLL